MLARDSVQTGYPVILQRKHSSPTFSKENTCSAIENNDVFMEVWNPKMDIKDDWWEGQVLRELVSD